MNRIDYEKARLVDLLWCESHNDAKNGMKAVAFVVRNRVNAGWGSWLDVMDKHEQWRGNAKPSPNLDYTQYLFRELLWLVDGVFDGSEKDEMTSCVIGDKPVKALWYYRVDEPVSDFFKEKILADKTNHRMVGVVGGIWLFS